MIKYYIQRIKEEISPQGLKTIITMWILFSIGIASCEYAYADNEIYIDQSGATANIDLEQLGSGNIMGGLNSVAGTLTALDLDGLNLTLDINVFNQFFL